MGGQNSSTIKGYNPRVAWLAFVGGVAIYFANSAAQYKIPPIMIELNEALGMTLVESGWLMSVMSLLGLILALPAGGIIMKLGVRWATVLAASIQLVGSLIGTFAGGFGLMMASRALEGVALGLCNVVSFAVVTSFFPPEKRGVPNSLVTAMCTVSVFMMMNIAVPITSSFDWQGLWWFINLLSVLAVLAAFFLIPGKSEEINFDEGEAGALAEKVDYKKLLTNRSMWIVPIIFVLFNIGYYGISTYMPTYLVEGVGADQAAANLATSWNMLAGLPAALVAGVVLNKLQVRHRKYVTAAAMIILGACYFTSFMMPTVAAATAVMVILGFFCTFVPVSLYTIGPDIIPSVAYAAIILAIVTFGQNVGMTLGPLVVGYIVELLGDWVACSAPLAIMAIIGGVMAFFINVGGSDGERRQSKLESTKP